MKKVSAFAQLSVGGGHEAFSCDIIEPSGDNPEWHVLGDALKLINNNPETLFTTMDGTIHKGTDWDILIAHPPCTYLSNSGACRLYPRKGQLDQARYQKGLQAKEFFMAFYNANYKHICVENPIPSTVFGLPPYTQTIHPYEYGHPYSKKTCLWLKGLPLLAATDIVEPIGTFCPSGSYSHLHNAKHKGIFTKDRARS